MKTVYLSGPITGLTFQGATDWRQYAINALSRANISGVSPMRAKDYLAKLTAPISGHGREYADLGVLSTPQAVVARDRYDTTRVDVMLMNLLGADRISIGTMVELGWADSARVPVVGVIEPEGNVHDHMFVNQLIGFRVTTLDAGLDVVKAILSA
jgi:nucleoside 2-deoxyribosyltransferase